MPFLAFVFALPALAAPQAETPTATTRPPPDASIGPILPVPTDQCTCPGPILCCPDLVQSSSTRGKEVLGQLGVSITGMDVTVGASCWVHHVCQPDEVCVSSLYASIFLSS